MLESQVLVAMPQRKANYELCARVGVRDFSPRKIFRNSRPFSAKFFNGKSLKGGFFWEGTRISGQSSQWEGGLGAEPPSDFWVLGARDFSVKHLKKQTKLYL